MANPYQPPQTIQSPAEKHQELFDRINHYRWRGFYLGILLVIAMIILTPQANETVKPYLKILAILGSGMVLLSILSVLPLTIWGFVKGFRESRKGG